jgi:hypothetical protein
MNRYNTTQNIKTENNISRKSTVIYPNNPIDLQRDIYIRTTTADRLDKLALNFYNDASKWWIIASVNGLGKGTIIVPPNTRLRIPSQSQVEELLTKTNRNR